MVMVAMAAISSSVLIRLAFRSHADADADSQHFPTAKLYQVSVANGDADVADCNQGSCAMCIQCTDVLVNTFW
jgi:hypothetical protein